MIIRNFYDRRLAQASYLVGCPATGEALMIDPMRDVRVYLQMASWLGLKITAVTETHIHADYLSGTRQLSAATGATMYLSGAGGPDWQYGYSDDPMVVLLNDGDLIRLGNLTLQAMHTPGHTPEHLAFLLSDPDATSLPHSLFAGDFVFVGDVGRPDLLERAVGKAGAMEQGARDLFRSLRKLAELPDSLLIWPGHGAGSSCGKALGDTPVTSLGYQRRANWALLAEMEDRFVDEILAGQPDPPYYFAEMKRLNQAGPDVLTDWPRPKHLTTAVGQLIDVRDFDEIRERCFDAAIAVPHCNSFTGWAGWVVRFDEPITLLASDETQAQDAARDLAAIGLDQVAGWLSPADLASSPSSGVPLVDGGGISEDVVVLDVRGGKEYLGSHIRNAKHIPFGHLQKRLAELPRDQQIVVHCATGGRSLIAYSILRKAGFKNVQELANGVVSIESHWPELMEEKLPSPALAP
jgi:hydroxyacylglutathione hydrolase